LVDREAGAPVYQAMLADIAELGLMHRMLADQTYHFPGVHAPRSIWMSPAVEPANAVVRGRLACTPVAIRAHPDGPNQFVALFFTEGRMASFVRTIRTSLPRRRARSAQC